MYGKKLVEVVRPSPHPFLTAAVGPKPVFLPPEPWCVSYSSRNSAAIAASESLKLLWLPSPELCI